jgi:molybdopterin-guanine dinucleotide biosynthesis protein B
LARFVGIVGYKNSGKTTLTQRLAQELTLMGRKVAVIKHTSHPLDVSGKDTAILGEVVNQVGLVSPDESAVFWKSPLSLEDIVAYLDADIVLVEGFKAETTFPKVVCLRGEPDDRDLFDGLAICAVGLADQVYGVDVPLFSRDEVGRVAALVDEKAFKLPNLDCGGCGHERCIGMAREIVAGTGSVDDCVSLQPSTEVRIDGELVSMNPFIAAIVRDVVVAMLSSLKGFKKGKIEISM